MGDKRKPVVERLKEARHTATDELDEVLLSATLVRSLQTVDARVMKSVKVCSVSGLSTAFPTIEVVKDCSVSGLSRSFPNIAIR